MIREGKGIKVPSDFAVEHGEGPHLQHKVIPVDSFSKATEGIARADEIAKV